MALSVNNFEYVENVVCNIIFACCGIYVKESKINCKKPERMHANSNPSVKLVLLITDYESR